MIVRLIVVAGLFAGLLAGASASSSAAAEPRERSLPETIDPGKRYVFFLYGQYMDKRGPRGDLDYYGILDSLEGMGFVVMGGMRGLLSNDGYADNTAADVRALLDAGVPASNITVAGHSKGGFIALMVASKVRDPGVSYAIFAGCSLPGTGYRRPYMRFVNRDAERMKGRFVVGWAEDDPLAQTCNEAMDKASVTYRNIRLPSGQGHRLFNLPDQTWLSVLAEHAGAAGLTAQVRD